MSHPSWVWSCGEEVCCEGKRFAARESGLSYFVVAPRVATMGLQKLQPLAREVSPHREEFWGLSVMGFVQACSPGPGWLCGFP